MNITIVDAIILLIILLGGVIGFKEGVIKELTSIIGLVIVVITYQFSFTKISHSLIFGESSKGFKY